MQDIHRKPDLVRLINYVRDASFVLSSGPEVPWHWSGTRRGVQSDIRGVELPAHAVQSNNLKQPSRESLEI